MEPGIWGLVMGVDELGLRRRIFMRKTALENGLYLGQLPILEYIISNPGCRQTEIAHWLEVTPASIALSTKRLQKAGMIRKTTDETNLRCNRLYITEDGLAKAEDCRLAFEAFDEQCFSSFSEEERRLFKGFLERSINQITPETADMEGKETMYQLESQLTRIEK